jgi:anti-sigma factor ChrR (cupin superfamily)
VSRIDDVAPALPRMPAAGQDATRCVLALNPAVLLEQPGYEPLRPGVDILYLYKDDASGASSALLRYAAGSHVPSHQHSGYEHVFVLSGEQEDERGLYPAGTFVVNPPGTSHRVWSTKGCLVLIVWQRPVVFLERTPDS